MIKFNYNNNGNVESYILCAKIGYNINYIPEIEHQSQYIFYDEPTKFYAGLRILATTKKFISLDYTVIPKDEKSNTINLCLNNLDEGKLSVLCFDGGGKMYKGILENCEDKLSVLFKGLGKITDTYFSSGRPTVPLHQIKQLLLDYILIVNSILASNTFTAVSLDKIIKRMKQECISIENIASLNNTRPGMS